MTETQKSIYELRKAILCLNLEVVPSIADDVSKKAENVIALLEEFRGMTLSVNEPEFNPQLR